MSQNGNAERLSSPLSDRKEPVRLPLTSGKPDMSGYLARAMTRLGVQQKEIEQIWGCSHVYVSRVLSDQDPLPESRIAELREKALPLYRAMLEEACKDVDILTGSRAAAARVLEGVAAFIGEDARLTVPFRMAEMPMPKTEDGR